MSPTPTLSGPSIETGARSASAPDALIGHARLQVQAALGADVDFDSEVPPVFRPLLEPARYKGAYGGRGSGKSHHFASRLVANATRRPGYRVVCIREFQRTLEHSVKRLVEDKIKQYGVSDRFRVLNTHIESPGAGVIIFQGMQTHTAESIKSLEGFDLAWVEEAQALSKRSLDLLRPTIRRPGSELWFSWNPNTPTDPVDALLRRESQVPGSIVVQANWRDNPWFPEVLRTDLEWDRSRDPEKYAHVWEGGYQRHSEARVFRNWRVEEFETPSSVERFYLGADWGFSVDPAVMVRSWIDGRTLYVDHEAYRIGCEIDYLPFLFGGVDDLELRGINEAAWKSLPAHYKYGDEKWSGVPGAREWPSTTDSARPETISYLQRHGFPRLGSARKGAGSIEEGVEFLRSFDIVVHPRCRHSIDELTCYAYKIDRLTDEVLPTLADQHNHVIDSLRYSVESTRRGGYWLL
jgi:phage terminase large subunit